MSIPKFSFLARRITLFCKLNFTPNKYFPFDHTHIGPSFIRFHKFHTSQVKHINPGLVALLRPLGKVMAILVGRGFRKWWHSLPKSKQQLFIIHLKRNKWKYFGILGISGVGGYSFYSRHSSLTPLTDRKRFVLFDPTEFREISNVQFEQTLKANEHSLLPPNHPYVARVKRVALRILKSNSTIPQVHSKYWSITVIDSPEENCFVFPTGQIVMCTGMLDVLENDDQVAVILAHEISHAILDHKVEIQSYSSLFEILKLMAITLIWALMPNDFIAIIAHYISDVVIETLTELPYNRKIEHEADVVGLFLMASACYDVREASALWGQLYLMDVSRGELDQFGWLSTHPSHMERQSSINALMEPAMNTRKKHKCSTLTKMDPRIPVFLAQKRCGGYHISNHDSYSCDENLFLKYANIIERFS